MGFCVLHYDKQTGSAPGLSQHIERGRYRDGEWEAWTPDNADASRTYLNRELIPGNQSRDERINRRIKEAGIKGVRKNQVKALTVIMSASCEDMQRITDEDRLEDWCEASIRWAQETHGLENIVSAVLHMDEKTPHLHLTVVPIVRGKSKDQDYRERKAKEEEERTGEKKIKRKYKKRDTDAPRLCAADVMARTRLTAYQTSYAKAVEEFGLERGLEGSKAKHVDINDWYKTLLPENRNLKQETAKKNTIIATLMGDKAKLTGLMEDASAIGLTAMQTLRLYRGEELEVDKLTLKDYPEIPITNANATWRLRFTKELQILHKRIWKTAKDWVYEATQQMKEWLREQKFQKKTQGLGQ